MPKIQLTQTVVVKNDRYPAPKDGGLALAQLFDLGNSAIPQKRDLDAAGFVQQGPGLWTHADGSWIESTADRGVQFGVGPDRLSQLPELMPKVAHDAARGVDTRPSIKGKDWTWFKAHTALGKLGVIQDDVMGKATLLRAGFVVSARNESTTEETWVHPDGSWFKSDFQGYTSSRGWKGYSLLELQAGEHHNLVRPLGTKPRVPASMARYAVAKIGLVDSRSAGRLCKAKGFVKVGDTWIHKDGSWVKNQQGSISVGWKGHELDALPYSNGSGWS